MWRLPAEPSSFMAGTPPVMYDAEWSGSGRRERAGNGGRGGWGGGGGVTRVTAGRLMEWRSAVKAEDDGDDSLLPTVDADLRVQRRWWLTSTTSGWK